MTRLCAAVFCLALSVLTLTGCSEQGKSPENTVLEEEVPQDGEDIVVGFSQIGSESDWRNGNTESIRSAFAAENGYFLLFEDGQQKQENQIKAIRNFILQEVDYIILDPIIETGWDAVLQEAKDAGIPVIVVDRSVEVADDSLYTCRIGSDFVAEGEMAGEWLASYLEGQGRTEEEIRIVTLQGTPGSSAQLGRTEGFGNILQDHPNWTMLELSSGDFTQAKGREVMDYFLDTYEDIDVVVSENDNMAFGAIDAIREAGKTCGPDGEITLISFDCARAAFEAMLRGEINVDVECNPLLGPTVSDIIQKLERGEEVEKVNHIEERYYDTTMDLESLMKERVY